MSSNPHARHTRNGAGMTVSPPEGHGDRWSGNVKADHIAYPNVGQRCPCGFCYHSVHPRRTR